jgi:two-component system, cell cycle sensor histidine kinase PleC
MALARCRAPAWVIDPAKGRVLAANPAGATRLGLRPDAASGTLDAAMPGLVRLRALMREPDLLDSLWRGEPDLHRAAPA